MRGTELAHLIQDCVARGVGNRPEIDDLVLPQIQFLAHHMRNREDAHSVE